MKSRFPLVLAGAAILAAAIAGCSSTAGSPSYGTAKTPASSGTSGSATTTTASGKDVATATNPLGTIVVNGKGMTAYVFDNDKAGATTSACSGACAATWPAITSSTATPTVDGVTGKVGTISATGGGFQVTINGMPVYTFANDKAAGDTNGEGVGKVWWVIDPSGKEVKAAPSKY